MCAALSSLVFLLADFILQHYVHFLKFSRVGDCVLNFTGGQERKHDQIFAGNRIQGLRRLRLPAGANVTWSGDSGAAVDLSRGELRPGGKAGPSDLAKHPGQQKEYGPREPEPLGIPR